MAKIKVEVDYTISDGCEVKFNAPINTASTLVVYYPDTTNKLTFKEFMLIDSQGHEVGGSTPLEALFGSGVLINVILDVTNGTAQVLNATTNRYLENRFEEVIEYVDTEIVEAIGEAIGGAY